LREIARSKKRFLRRGRKTHEHLVCLAKLDSSARVDLKSSCKSTRAKSRRGKDG
jgi:hypothetical protein